MTNTAFFGPEKFCAVVPKKIVIVDDGFYWKAGESDGVIKNKDSIVEFDIEGSTLARGSASVSVSFNIGTSSYYYGKTEE